MNSETVLAALRGIQDPETGRDLVAMGLIYGVHVAGDQVQVTMTTTTRGCPLAQLLRAGVEAAVLALPGIAHVEVTLSYDPLWTPARMAD
jgi:metal-sulfur cluster biosynthetic enzyme